MSVSVKDALMVELAQKFAPGRCSTADSSDQVKALLLIAVLLEEHTAALKKNR